MNHYLSHIRRILSSVAAAMLMSVVCAPESKADGDAAVLLPILEAWQGTQVYQYSQQLSTALNQWATQLENLEKGSQVAKFMRDAYGKIQEGEMYYNSFKTLYYNEKSLIDACVYGYEWMRDSITDGTIDIATAAEFTALLEHLYNKAWSNANYAYKLFANDSSGMTLKERIQDLARKSKETKDDADAVNIIVGQLQEDALAKVQGEINRTLLAMAYGSVPESLNKHKLNGSQIKVKDALKDLEDEPKDVINSDSGAASAKVRNSLEGSSEAVLNLVCAIIGLLAVIMAIPAYIRYTKGEKQSTDALYKLFMGTIAIIAIIQVFGRFILSFA